MKVKVRIKATVTDLVLAEKYKNACVNGFFTADDGRRLPYEEIGAACDEVMSYTAEGEYRREGRRVTVTYEESPELGFSCTTSLIFDENDREVLTMIRAGEMNAAFRFDKRDPRQLCTYETPIMPIEFTVNTRTVRNGLEETGGVLLLDYYLEMRGVNTERNRLLIEVQPL
ncbi:MAG: DUF1934 domain-containing protein [Clostridia bacterium]|nr:DUF1934 domain-containing protein [Clostridia bacterium]